MSITRTVTTVIDLTPAELAAAFCEMDSAQQAEFFHVVGKIAEAWRGTGWCQQALAIAHRLTPEGRLIIERLADHAGLLEAQP